MALAKGYRAYLLGLVAWIGLTFARVVFGGLSVSSWRVAWIVATGALAGLSVTLLLTGHRTKWGVPVVSWVGHWTAMGFVAWGVIAYKFGRKDELDGLATLMGSIGLMGVGFGVFVLSLVVESVWRFVRGRRSAPSQD